jgi:hypothetical protein
VSDTARVLLTAAVLSAATLATFAWRLLAVDPDEPARLIGELRLAQWAAVLLAATGAISIGLALGHMAVPMANWDAAIGILFIGIAGFILQRDPREALLILAAAFVVQALVNIAHRPGWLTPDLAPRWFTIGCAMYDVLLAGVCFWARRR